MHPKGFVSAVFLVTGCPPGWEFTSGRADFACGVATDGNGAGAIDPETSTPDDRYQRGSEATVAALAETGSSFTDWYDAKSDGTEVSVDNPYSFELAADTSLWARFDLVPPGKHAFSLGVATDSGGNVGESSTANGSYYTGYGVTAQAAGVAGADFIGWYDAATGGSEVSTANPCAFALGEDTTLYAQFGFTYPYDLSDESYTLTEIFDPETTITDAHANWNQGNRYNTILTTHNGYVYLVYITNVEPSPYPDYVDTGSGVVVWEVRVAKIDASIGAIVADEPLTNDDNVATYTDYVSLEDGHMPTEMRDGTVNYWRSDSAEDISSFSWYGDANSEPKALSGSAPLGYGQTYMAFTHDHDGEMYYYSRLASNLMPFKSFRAFLVSAYDTGTSTSSALGAENDFQNICNIWEDNGEYKDGAESTYSKIHGWVGFDRLGTMHVVSPILNWAMPKPPTPKHYSTDITYIQSTDEGVSWQRASGDAITMPVCLDANPASDSPDVVHHKHDGLQYFAAAGADYWGNPLVLVFDDTAAEPATMFFMWNSVTGEWVYCGDAGVPHGNDTAFHMDRSGVITVARDDSYITRMWRPDGQVRSKYIGGPGHLSLVVDRKYLIETGDIMGAFSRGAPFPENAIGICKIAIDRDGWSYPCP